MTHVNRSGIFSFFLVPLSVALILFGIFSIVWLRSSVRTAEYSIAALDHRRMEIIRDRRRIPTRPDVTVPYLKPYRLLPFDSEVVASFDRQISLFRDIFKPGL